MNPIDYDAVRNETSHVLADAALSLIDGAQVKGWFLEIVEDNQGDTVYILRVVDVFGRYYFIKQRRKDSFVDSSTFDTNEFEMYKRIKSGELQA